MWRSLVAILFIAFLSVASASDELQAVPALTAHVVDQTGTLDASQRHALEQQLTALEQSKGSQVVVLMVATTAPEDIASYANRIANVWKIGRRSVGDGVLVVVAKNDRKMRLEVAKTLEGAIPDIAAARIIDSAMKPRFRENDFAGGLLAAVSQIEALVSGEALPTPTVIPQTPQGTGGAFDWGELAIFLFLGVTLGGPAARALLGNALGSLAAGGLTGIVAYIATTSAVLSAFAGLAALIFTLSTASARSTSTRGHGGRWGGGSGGGGWSSGSSDGGGFSSGGGGDFGGGGASGDW